MDGIGDDQGPFLLGVCLTLYGLSLVAYGVRIWSRLHPKVALTAADYTITISMICKTLSIIFMSLAISHGFGRHVDTIPEDDFVLVADYLFAVFVTATPASSFARISIACLLLQFTTHRTWRVIIWGSVLMQISMFLLYDTAQFIQCKSAISSKERWVNAECLSPNLEQAFTYSSVAVGVFGDLVCAIIPIFLIWRLSRSVLERILVCVLMASSLVASGCGIPKIYYMVTFDFTSSDAYYNMIPEFFWGRMEEAIIIIAACAPLLKCPIERLLRRLGLRPPQHAQAHIRQLNLVSPGVVVRDSDAIFDPYLWQGMQQSGTKRSVTTHSGTTTTTTTTTISDLERGSVPRSYLGGTSMSGGSDET